ncbi:MAG: hypothetical protein OHK0022_31660 [Roseiflexaceae bacterium]
MNTTCGCCAVADDTPAPPPINRPGLSALAYRVGTHALFLARMKARLSSHVLRLPTGMIKDGAEVLADLRPLRALTTRSPDDPAIALLDAWALVADVLTFYQERIANEGYLRTATERRSVLELARLIGYALRPGVAASVYLAFELEQPRLVLAPGSPQAAAPDALEQVPPVTIPAGSRAQSVPAAGALPQSFETSEPLVARPDWNAITPRLTRPQLLTRARFAQGGTLYLKGVTTNLKPNDPLLLNIGEQRLLYRVLAVTPDALASRTALLIEPWLGAERDRQPGGTAPRTRRIGTLIRYLEQPASIPPKNRQRLNQRLAQSFAKGSDSAARVVAALRPSIARTLYAGWRNLPVTPPVAVEPQALRVRATLFGSSAPMRVRVPQPGDLVKPEEWELRQDATVAVKIEVAVFASAPGGSSSSDSEGGSESESEPSAEPGGGALNVAITIGSVRATTALLALPPFGQEISASLLIEHSSVQITLRRDTASSLYSLSLAFQPWDRTFFIDFDLVDGDFRVQGRPDNLSVVEVLGSLDTGIGLTVGGLPLLRIHAEGVLPPNNTQGSEATDTVWLDAAYGQITPGSWVALEVATGIDRTPRMLVAQVDQVSEGARAAYGVSAKSTRLRLRDQINLATQQPDRWLHAGDTFGVVRGTVVYGQSEPLALAEEPITEPVGGGQIELGALVDGLEPGRWLLISGERADIPGVGGVHASELAMLAGVRQGYDPARPGDASHSTLLLAVPLAYRYTRTSVTIYANVAHATHGETRSEVLGGGAGATPLQRFVLRQMPLTYVSAPTPQGIESTLELRVNDLRWHEVASMSGQGPTDHSYTTTTSDDGRTTVVFGDGRHGARLPSGSENVRAVYRVGIGQAGNVEAGAITLLASRPLGVKGVINPLPATGGADRESRDQARQNAPLAVAALDRLVSVQDYEDFARTFAGIGKASAHRLSDGQRTVVHVTVAGEQDIPIAPTSDLYRNLREALFAYGDPALPVRVALRELLTLVVDAGVALLPDYLWEAVEPQIRAALLDTFGFAHRSLGQDALLTEALAAIQGVPGVAAVDIDAFGAIPETIRDPRAAGGRRTLSPAAVGERIRAISGQPPAARVRARLAQAEPQGIGPAQIALLLPGVPETVKLRRLPA